MSTLKLTLKVIMLIRLLVLSDWCPEQFQVKRKEHFEVESNGKHLELINDKVKDGRVTKLKILVSEIEEREDEKD